VPSGDLAKAVATLRATLRDLEGERQQVETAPLPAAYAKQVMRKEIDRLAAIGTPDVLRCTELGLPVHFTQGRVLDAAGSPAPTLHQVTDAAALVCWLMRDIMIDRLSGEIDEIADDKNALLPEERVGREKELRLAALGVEREIEAATSAAENRGTEIRRSDTANPIAVLNLSDDLIEHWR
jgi:hypothetical protein